MPFLFDPQALMRLVTCGLATTTLALVGITSALAAPEPSGVFRLLWERYDEVVANGSAERSWTWGPLPLTAPLVERFAGVPGNQRTVQYYDKGRMELNDPGADPSSPWFVTSGLLPTELMTGRRQVGFSEFERWRPSYIAAVGDYGNFPAYPDLLPLYENPGRIEETEIGRPVTDLLNPDLSVGSLTAFAGDPATVLLRGENNHGVPRAFVEFQRQEGVFITDGRRGRGQVYDPLFIFGLPVTPAVWVQATVGGVERPVLLQVFERRVLTYSPSNPPAFRVEMGNVGAHYHRWISDPGSAEEFRPADGRREVRVGAEGVYTLEVEERSVDPGAPANTVPSRKWLNYQLYYSPDGGTTRELRFSGEIGGCYNVAVSLLEVLNSHGLQSRIGLSTSCADNPSVARGSGTTTFSSYDGGRTFIIRGTD